LPVLAPLLFAVLAQGSPPDCGFGVIREDLDTIPWVHKVSEVPVADGKPCVDTALHIDLSDEMPPVGNQGHQGSCTAWGFGYHHRTHIEFLERGWDVTDPSHQGSPAFIYNQINRGVDRGSWFSEAMALLCEQGCGTMTDCPYDSTDYLTWPTEQAYRNAMTFRTDRGFWFDRSDPDYIDLIRQHLANGNTCVTAIYLYAHFMDIRNYNNIYCSADRQGSPFSGHAATIVGYDDTMSTRDGPGAFRLINSMGTAWGDSGYFWMSYHAIVDTLMVYGYTCYVTDLADYQPVLIGTVRFSHPTRDRVGIRFGVGTPGRSLWHKDFRSWRAADADHPFPYQRIPFDLTDGAPWLTGGPEDTLYLAGLDDTADSRTGFADRFEVEHLERHTQGSSTEMPLMIPDDGDTVAALLLLPFTAVGERDVAGRSAERSCPTIRRGTLTVPHASSLEPRASSLLDAAGRKVLDLHPGPNDVTRLAPGVYFLRSAVGGQPSSVTKVLLTR
jgi:hypothetical protein